MLNPFDKNNYYVKKSIGKEGKEFYFYKFRTMIPNSDEQYLLLFDRIQGFGKIRDDPRIIPERKWMRKTHFDEIPNLYNFFKGELNFVGIRPKDKNNWTFYTQKEKERILKFKPGLNSILYAYKNLRDLNDIKKAEFEYISKKEENSFKTDLEYFLKIIYNKTILMKMSE